MYEHPSGQTEVSIDPTKLDWMTGLFEHFASPRLESPEGQDAASVAREMFQEYLGNGLSVDDINSRRWARPADESSAYVDLSLDDLPQMRRYEITRPIQIGKHQIMKTSIVYSELYPNIPGAAVKELAN